MKAEAIVAEDTALALVDAHQHFQDLGAHYYPWLCDRNRALQLEGDLSGIRRDYLPADYARDVAGAKVVKTVHVQNGWDPTDPVGETRWLQRLSNEHGLPTAIVAFADLGDPHVQTVLERHLESPAVRGVRQILNWHEDRSLRVASAPDLMENAAWRRGFALLPRFGLSFDLQIYWPQMDQALTLAAAFPDALLVLNHFGMPIDRSREGVEQWKGAVTRLAVAPNVFVKLSGFGLGSPRWTLADTVPLLKTAIDVFGARRVMVGTNLPVESLFADGPKILRAIKGAVAGLSDGERHAVLMGTAERVYRI